MMMMMGRPVGHGGRVLEREGGRGSLPRSGIGRRYSWVPRVFRPVPIEGARGTPRASRRLWVVSVEASLKGLSHTY